MKKSPGPALIMDESVPGPSCENVATESPFALSTHTLTPERVGSWEVASFAIEIRKRSPVILKGGLCFGPVPVVVFTTCAPGHSASGPGANSSTAGVVLVPVVPVVVPVVVPAVGLAEALADGLAVGLAVALAVGLAVGLVPVVAVVVPVVLVPVVVPVVAVVPAVVGLVVVPVVVGVPPSVHSSTFMVYAESMVPVVMWYVPVPSWIKRDFVSPASTCAEAISSCASGKLSS